MSNLPPVWWQNSKVSYSFFASGSSSYIDFSMHKQADDEPVTLEKPDLTEREVSHQKSDPFEEVA